MQSDVAIVLRGPAVVLIIAKQKDFCITPAIVVRWFARQDITGAVIVPYYVAVVVVAYSIKSSSSNRVSGQT
jgi:hypothetical protein